MLCSKHNSCFATMAKSDFSFTKENEETERRGGEVTEQQKVGGDLHRTGRGLEAASDACCSPERAWAGRGKSSMNTTNAQFEMCDASKCKQQRGGQPVVRQLVQRE
jgi:hypothetical protein